MSAKPSSELASVVRQFVRAERHPTSSELDRFVLAVDSKAPGIIQQALPNVLRRVRDQLGGPKSAQQRRRFDKAALANNADERRALQLVQEHVRRIRAEEVGSCSERDVFQLLGRVHVLVLDADLGGQQHREANELLRQAVLQEPPAAAQAWSEIVSLCHDLAAHRSSLDRDGLVHRLETSGLVIRGRPSHASDRATLYRLSVASLERFDESGRVRIGSQNVSIVRQCSTAMATMVETGGFVLVGGPGSGKSGALVGLAQSLRSSGQDVLFFAVQDLEARSLGSLRQELGIVHEISDILRDWPTTSKPPVLILDGFDAARDDVTARTLLSLALDVHKSGRWRVVVSIREFDLRCNGALAALFQGTPSTSAASTAFPGVRHVYVAHLDDAELAEVAQRLPELDPLITNAPSGLRALLRVPFNLQLAADLLRLGIGLGRIAPIRTQIELLDRHWEARVIRSDGRGDEREAVLRRVTVEMVRARALRAERAVVSSEPQLVRGLREILSAELLREWQANASARPERHLLAFAHHILFDDAVARLVVSPISARNVELLKREPDFAFAFRSSLRMHFERLWSRSPDREDFWEAVFDLCAIQDVVAIAQIVGPAVAADRAAFVEDLRPLLRSLTVASMTTTATTALRYLVGALMSRDQTAAADPWYLIARELVAYPRVALAIIECVPAGLMSASLESAAGEAARAAFAAAAAENDVPFFARATRAVVRTYSSSNAESRCALASVLVPGNVAEKGHAQLRWLAREVPSLARVAPELVVEIYAAAFAGRPNAPDVKTSMSSSNILPLVSTVQQDYQGGLFALAEHFKSFVLSEPIHATRALCLVLDSYVRSDHAPSRDAREASFPFGQAQASIQQDDSYVWDAPGSLSRDEPVAMLSAFGSVLDRLSREGSPPGVRLSALVQVVVTHNHWAILWKRLLEAGSRSPSTLGLLLADVAIRDCMLVFLETSHASVQLVQQIFPLMDEAQRRRIENVLLGIPEWQLARDVLRDPSRLRDEVIAGLPLGLMLTPEAIQIRTDLDRAGLVRKSRPPIRFRTRPISDPDELAALGIPQRRNASAELSAEWPVVAQFVEACKAEPPNSADINAVFVDLQAMRAAVEAAATAVSDHEMVVRARGLVAAAAAAIASGSSGVRTPEVEAFVRDTLLSMVSLPAERPTTEQLAHFEEVATWTAQAPRIEGAIGLMALVKTAAVPDPSVLEAVADLASDVEPAVAYQVVLRLTDLFRVDVDRMWTLLEHVAEAETRRAILRVGVNAMYRLRSVEPNRVSELIIHILARTRGDGPGTRSLRTDGVRALALIDIVCASPAACEYVESMAEVVQYDADETISLVRSAVEAIEVGHERGEARRRRGAQLLGLVIAPRCSALEAIDQRWRAGEAHDEHELAVVKSNLRVLEHAALLLDHALDPQNQHRGKDEARDVRRTFDLVAPWLTKLGTVAVPAIAHHLVGALVHCIEFDPKQVLRMIRDVTVNGAEHGYAAESMAVAQIATLVRRYLSEYRDLLRVDDASRLALIQVLDAFVRSGWLEAQSLAYDLESVFR